MFAALRTRTASTAASATAASHLTARRAATGRFMAARMSSSSSSPTRPCPSCSAPIPYPASPCPSCGGLVTVPQGLSLHSLLSVSDPIPEDGGKFDIPGELKTLPAHGYALDARDLRTRMLRRQATLHPDRHGGTDLAADLSARVNRAYETLANPLRRAQYILDQYGMDIQEREDATDHNLLMEVLEARETLEEASTPEDIQELRDENHAKVEAVEAKIKDAFSRDPPDLEEAKRLCVELKYWVGLEDAAREKL